MANETFKIEGLKEVTDALKDLPTELKTKILKAFISRAGKKFIVDEIKPVIPSTYSLETRSSVKVMSVPGDPLKVQAGVSKKGYKLRWTELGTKVRKTRKGKNLGKITGHSKIQPIIESQIENIVKYAETEIGNEINKNLQRRLKKLKKR